jgi:heptosyltransferase-2
MGDVILATSLFAFLKKKIPGCEIHFCTHKRYTGLFADDPRLSGLTGVEFGNESASLAPLAAQTWDLCIDLQNSPRSARLRKRYFPKVAARRFDKLHLQRALLLLLRQNFYTPQNHVAARYIRASGIAGVPDEEAPPLKLYFSCDADSVKRAVERAGAADKPTIALMPFSAWKNKQWPAESYAAVGRHFGENGWNIAVCAGPEEGRQAAGLCSEIGPHCINLAGSHTLYDLGCFLTTCALALGNDTGLTHLARACGVRTGVIYGSTTWHFGFFPFGAPLFRIFQAKLYCRPCHAHGGSICWRVSRPCLQRVRAEDVIAGLEQLHAQR